MQQQLSTAQFSDSIAIEVSVIYGVHSKNFPVDYELSHIYTPLPSTNRFGQRLISYYDTKDYAMLYTNNRFKLEIYSASIKTSDANSPFLLAVLKPKTRRLNSCKGKNLRYTHILDLHIYPIRPTQVYLVIYLV